MALIDQVFSAAPTALLTVFIGALTFTLGQIAVKLFIDPVHHFKRTVGDIALALIEHANVYANPGSFEKEARKKVSEDLRRLSACLMSQAYLIPFYLLTRYLFCLPSREKVGRAADKLMGISNSICLPEETIKNISMDNSKNADEVRTLLGIFVPE